MASLTASSSSSSLPSCSQLLSSPLSPLPSSSLSLSSSSSIMIIAIIIVTVITETRGVEGGIAQWESTELELGRWRVRTQVGAVDHFSFSESTFCVDSDFRYPFHPRVTAMWHVKDTHPFLRGPFIFCSKCRLQLTQYSVPSRCKFILLNKDTGRRLKRMLAGLAQRKVLLLGWKANDMGSNPSSRSLFSSNLVDHAHSLVALPLTVNHTFCWRSKIIYANRL